MDIVVKSKTVSWRFLILDLPNSINMLVGLDLMPVFGIGITGLPTELDKLKPDPGEELSDQPRSSRFFDKDSKYQKYCVQLLQAIQPQLDAN